jgi:hypothetical protein
MTNFTVIGNINIPQSKEKGIQMALGFELRA